MAGGGGVAANAETVGRAAQTKVAPVLRWRIGRTAAAASRLAAQEGDSTP